MDEKSKNDAMVNLVQGLTAASEAIHQQGLESIRSFHELQQQRLGDLEQRIKDMKEEGDCEDDATKNESPGPSPDGGAEVREEPLRAED